MLGLLAYLIAGGFWGHQPHQATQQSGAFLEESATAASPPREQALRLEQAASVFILAAA